MAQSQKSLFEQAKKCAEQHNAHIGISRDNNNRHRLVHNNNNHVQYARSLLNNVLIALLILTKLNKRFKQYQANQRQSRRAHGVVHERAVYNTAHQRALAEAKQSLHQNGQVFKRTRKVYHGRDHHRPGWTVRASLKSVFIRLESRLSQS